MRKKTMHNPHSMTGWPNLSKSSGPLLDTQGLCNYSIGMSQLLQDSSKGAVLRL